MKNFPLTTIEDVTKLLDEKSIKYEIQYHDPIETIEASKTLLKPATLPDFKDNIFPVNKFIKDKKDTNAFYLLVQDPSQKVEFKQIAQLVGVKDNLRLADPAALTEKVNVVQGSVNPFALINNPTGVKFLLDKVVHDKDTICIHPMKNTSSVYLKTKDLLDLLHGYGIEPKVLDFGGSSNAPSTTTATTTAPVQATKEKKPKEEKEKEKEEIPLTNKNVVKGFNEVQKLLESAGVSYELQTHGKVIEKDLPSTITPPKNSAYSKYTLASTKLLNDKKGGKYYVLLHDFKMKLDYKQLTTLLNLKENPKLGDRQIVKDYFNVQDATMSPFAVMNTPEAIFIVDKSLLDNGVVCVHPMDATQALFLRTEDLLKVISTHKATLLDFSAKAEAHPEKELEKKKQEEHKDSKGIEYKKEEKNFAKWYSQVITKSEMIDYYPDISGCYILRPWSYQIWEVIQSYFDKKIKLNGVENAYFPLFVSKNALEKEKEHVEGFSPEVAWVTKSGTKDLDVPIAIRPTSETIMYPSYANWIRSHRDLPLKLNQWTNIVRWEFKNPTPFIRTREFLWQEGHTAHATLQEADEQVFEILDYYKDVYENLLAVPVIQGIKSENEKFAGALRTTTIETMIPTTGKGIQCATSHNLAQNFSKMFEIKFESKEMTSEFVYQTSWGMTTRTIGVAVMMHGDDKGLVLPPKVAPIQVVLVPIIKSENEKDGLKEKILDGLYEVYKQIKAAGIKAKVDDRDNYKPGWKYNYWEMKGVPLRIEFGLNELNNKQVVLCCRDNGEKLTTGVDGLSNFIQDLLEKIHNRMFQKAKDGFFSCIKVANNNDELFRVITEKKMAKTMWCDTMNCEDNVKQMVKDTLVKIIEAKKDADNTEELDITEITAKTLCKPLEQDAIPANQKCFSCDKPATKWVLWGKTY